MLEIAVLIVLFAFAFTFTNGFQDASSIAATFIASRSASPKAGILLVAGMKILTGGQGRLPPWVASLPQILFGAGEMISPEQKKENFSYAAFEIPMVIAIPSTSQSFVSA